MKNFFLFFLILGLDRFSKLFVKDNFFLGESVPVIPDFLHCTYILNKGAAFGILENNRYLFIGIAVIVLIIVCCFYKKILQEESFVQYAVALFVSGTFGNLIDRIIYGSVIDFIDFRFFPVFNVADMAISGGVFLILWSVLWKAKTRKNL